MGIIPLKSFSVSAHCKQGIIIRDATIHVGSLVSTKKNPEVAKDKGVSLKDGVKISMFELHIFSNMVKFEKNTLKMTRTMIIHITIY